MMIKQGEKRGKLILIIENEKTISRNDIAPFVNSEYVKIKNVEKLEYGSFKGFLSLEKLILTRVKNIGDEAFCDCKNIVSVGFNEGIKTIGKKAFFGCKSITSLEFPETLTLIGAQCFRGCSSIEKIHFDSDTRELVIGDRAFAMTKEAFRSFCKDKVIDRIDLPPNLNALGNAVFEGKDVKSLEIFAGRRGHAAGAFNSIQCEKLILSYDNGSPFCDSDFYAVPDDDFIWSMVSEEGSNG